MWWLWFCVCTSELKFLFLYVYKWVSMCTSDPCVQVILFCVYKWAPCHPRNPSRLPKHLLMWNLSPEASGKFMALNFDEGHIFNSAPFQPVRSHVRTCLKAGRSWWFFSPGGRSWLWRALHLGRPWVPGIVFRPGVFDPVTTPGKRVLLGFPFNPRI